MSILLPTTLGCGGAGGWDSDGEGGEVVFLGAPPKKAADKPKPKPKAAAKTKSPAKAKPAKSPAKSPAKAKPAKSPAKSPAKAKKEKAPKAATPPASPKVGKPPKGAKTPAAAPLAAEDAEAPGAPKKAEDGQATPVEDSGATPKNLESAMESAGDKGKAGADSGMQEKLDLYKQRIADLHAGDPPKSVMSVKEYCADKGDDCLDKVLVPVPASE